jgi:hypothetical protein
MAPRRRLLRPKVLAAVAASVAVIVGGLVAAVAGGFLFSDTSKPASVAEALRGFRLADPHPRANEGLYLYATTGGETLDVLRGATHRYPTTTSVALTHVACGTRLRWQPLEERAMTWTFCRSAGGPVLLTIEEVHTFFGQTDRTTYRCDPSSWPALGAAPGTSRPFACRSGRGREGGVALIVGRETVEVGGARLHAVHVRTTAHVSGGDRGTEVVDWWVEPASTLPVRLVLTSKTSRRVALVGTAHYREHAELRLSSLHPER